VGFDIVSLGPDTRRAVLARINSNVKGPKVGKYVVHVDEFESIALPCLSSTTTGQYLVIDEIGKMECFSKKFSAAIRKVYAEYPGTVVATIPHSRGKPLPLVEEVLSQPNIEVITVTHENRDDLPEIIYRKIKN